MKTCLATIALLALLADTAQADLLPPGQKRYKHEHVLTNLSDYPDYYFRLPKVAVLSSGEPFSVPSNPIFGYSLKLEANRLPTGRGPETISLDRTPFNSGTFNAVNDPAVRIVTYYQVAILPSGTLQLHQIAEQRFDKDGNLLVVKQPSLVVKQPSLVAGIARRLDNPLTECAYFALPAIAALLTIAALASRRKPSGPPVGSILDAPSQ